MTGSPSMIREYPVAVPRQRWHSSRPNATWRRAAATSRRPSPSPARSTRRRRSVHARSLAPRPAVQHPGSARRGGPRLWRGHRSRARRAAARLPAHAGPGPPEDGGSPTRRFARPGWYWPSRRSGSMRSCSRRGPWPNRGRRPATRRPAGRKPLTRLQALIKDNPTYADAYRALVAIHLKAGERAAAIAVAQGRPAGQPGGCRRRRAARAVAVGTPGGRPAARGGRSRRGPAHRRGDRRSATPRDR